MTSNNIGKMTTSVTIMYSVRMDTPCEMEKMMGSLIGCNRNVINGIESAHNVIITPCNERHCFYITGCHENAARAHASMERAFSRRVNWVMRRCRA